MFVREYLLQIAGRSFLISFLPLFISILKEMLSIKLYYTLYADYIQHRSGYSIAGNNFPYWLKFTSINWSYGNNIPEVYYSNFQRSNYFSNANRKFIIIFIIYISYTCIAARCVQSLFYVIQKRNGKKKERKSKSNSFPSSEKHYDRPTLLHEFQITLLYRCECEK